MYEKIKQLCKSKGISVNKLEKDLGFPKGSLCKVGAHAPSAVRVRRLAEYFNVSVEFLMGNDSADYVNEEAHEQDHPDGISFKEYKNFLDQFSELNYEGMKKVISYVDDLVTSGKYIKNSEYEGMENHA